MRIAVAGGFGLGYLIATGLSRAETAHNIVVLSRTPRREFTAVGIQVHVVDYHNKDLLQFALSGIDLVISTISGQEQLNLINAACHGRVSYFVPSEFEGPLNKRPPARQDPLDRGSSAALTLLRQWSDTKPRFKWTVFSCGIFMERFHPYGLAASLGIGNGEGVGAVGSYVADINAGIADYVPKDARGSSVKVCMTSVYDLVRFIIAAIDLGPSSWPTEFTMRGDKMSLDDLVSTISVARNMQFQSVTLSYEELIAHISYNTDMGQYARVSYLHRILETANGRYDFSRTTLNDAISSNRHVRFNPMSFSQWLATVLS
ncbi:isoflavone reductase family protein [Cordyceps fumosorosea ARSEF 2679]|uniref:Isoflavone reductase family protein n=1 Tax=Cordyceps fumosorosea (strain ARSEF 2679) TaxID=1081104 RepID=A0A167TMG5_CORFA|nr:isoflavone reductase family protein [Cordyceps fumosorosea ARSEF 2679]OAA60750.1 isoflavone reductase family protein [Cordyceps fumosorosea ARSEF 2679]